MTFSLIAGVVGHKTDDADHAVLPRHEETHREPYEPMNPTGRAVAAFEVSSTTSAPSYTGLGLYVDPSGKLRVKG